MRGDRPRFPYVIINDLGWNGGFPACAGIDPSIQSRRFRPGPSGFPACAGIDPNDAIWILSPRYRFPRMRGDRPYVPAGGLDAVEFSVSPHARG